MSFVPSYRSAPAIHAASISGASTGLAEVRLELFRFTVMAMSHANDSSGRSPGHPNKHDEAVVERTDSNEAWLAVIASIVGTSEVQAGKDLAGTTHIQTTLP